MKMIIVLTIILLSHLRSCNGVIPKSNGLYYYPKEDMNYRGSRGLKTISSLLTTTRRRKSSAVGWTPENIAILLYNDSSFLEGANSYRYENEIMEESRKSKRNSSNVLYLLRDAQMRSARIRRKVISPRLVGGIWKRASKRLSVASTVCREVSHACHIAVCHAAQRSIGGKLWKSCHSKYRVFVDCNSYNKEEEEKILSKDDQSKFLCELDTLLVSVTQALQDESIWIPAVERDGVKVWKTNVDVKKYPDVNVDTTCDEITVRSEAIMSAPPKQVYELFMDNSRVREYNDNCQELEDIEYISDTTKISWSATGKFGIFAARDFVTLVTFRELENNAYISLAVNIEHPVLAPVRNGYVRSQIQLAATFMQPIDGSSHLTKFTQVTKIGQLGGVADSPLAKRITNNLSEKAPLDFMKKFNHAVMQGFDRKEV